MFKCVAENKLKPLNIFYPDLEFQVREISKTLYFHFENNVIRLIIYFFKLSTCFIFIVWTNAETFPFYFFSTFHGSTFWFCTHSVFFSTVNFVSEMSVSFRIILMRYFGIAYQTTITPLKLPLFNWTRFLVGIIFSWILWFSCYRFSQTRKRYRIKFFFDMFIFTSWWSVRFG